MVVFNIQRLKLVVSGMLIFTLFACESNEQKPEEAFELVKEGMVANGDSNAYSDQPVVAEPTKAKSAKKPIVLTEEAQFAKETAASLDANEIIIKELKGKPDNSKILKKVSLVEKDNAALRLEMAAYLAEVKLRWETYKATTIEELAKITADLKTLKESVGD